MTVARDKQVRVSDIGEPFQPTDGRLETQYSTAQANERVLRCHDRAVKRITTEHSPDLFLTVAEVSLCSVHRSDRFTQRLSLVIRTVLFANMI